MLDEYETQGLAFITLWPDPLNAFQTYIGAQGLRVTNNFLDNADWLETFYDIYWPEQSSSLEIPLNFLIDRDGRVRARIGTIDVGTWSGYIEELL